MFELALCHAAADAETSAALVSHLEAAAAIRVRRETVEAPETVAARWEHGLGATAILLVLSPAAVPRRLSRQAWQPVLDHVERHEEPPLACLILRDCAFPPLLRRLSPCFTWTGLLSTSRELHRWVAGLEQRAAAPEFLPAHLPWFTNREEELEQLRRLLVDRAGTAVITGPPRSGKTSLALEFARQVRPWFSDVEWAQGRLHAQTQGRTLVVVDDAETQPAVSPPASLLITSPDAPPPGWPQVALTSVFTAPLFKCEDVPEPADPAQQALWHAMAACSRHGAPLSLAASIANLDAAEAAQACEQLLASGLADRFNEAGPVLRLRCRPATLDDALRRRHAEEVSRQIDRYRADAPAALDWAIEQDWSLAVNIGRRGFAAFRECGQLTRGIPMLEALERAARERADALIEKACRSDLDWIRESSGGALRQVPPGEQTAFDY